MIVATARKATEHLTTINKLQKASEDTQNIEETLAALRDLKSATRDLMSLYDVLRTRLPQEYMQGLDVRLTTLAQRVRSSHQTFDMQRRQAPQLRLIKSDVQSITQDLQNSWRALVSTVLNPAAEIIGIIRVIPDMREPSANLIKLHDQLRAMTLLPLRTPQQVAEFDARAGQLQTLLSELEGISPAVIAFLKTVLDQKATIADLSDEVLAWCRQAGRDRSFRITLHN
jgi:hypothetical protein